MRKFKFKIGDTVIVKEWNELVEEYGVEKDYGDEIIPCRENFISTMRCYCGEIAIIEKRAPNGLRIKLRFLDTDTHLHYLRYGHTFSEDMIKPYTEYDYPEINSTALVDFING